MGILTAEFPPSEGDATLASFSVSREPQKTRRRVGYCPQFDAHFASKLLPYGTFNRFYSFQLLIFSAIQRYDRA